MELTEDEIIKTNGNLCKHCGRKRLLPFSYEWTCISCGNNLIKRKHEISRIQRKKMNFINRLKYAELKIFCVYVDVYKIYEGNDYDKIFETLSTLKIKN